MCIIHIQSATMYTRQMLAIGIRIPKHISTISPKEKTMPINSPLTAWSNIQQINTNFLHNDLI